MNLRFSCRTYSGESLGEADRARLAAAADAMKSGPFGSSLRFRARGRRPRRRTRAEEAGHVRHDPGASAFIIGAAETARATWRTTGTRWNGSSSRPRRSAWERAGSGVLSAGGLLRGAWRLPRRAPSGGDLRGAHSRSGQGGGGPHAPASAGAGASRGRCCSATEELGRPLSPERAGAYAQAVEMVRRAPSASNRQPWRIVKSGHPWHFFIHRTPGDPPRHREDPVGVDGPAAGGQRDCHVPFRADRARAGTGRAAGWCARRPRLSRTR